MTLGMFDTVAVAMAANTGWSDLAPLCAIDKALHPVQQANYHQVTSLVPAGTPVYRINPEAGVLPLDGAHVPAVMRWKTGGAVYPVSAGIGLGLPLSAETGVIYHTGGKYEGSECEDLLDKMVAEAMTSVRGVENWTFKSAVACAEPDFEHPLRYHAAVATLTFLDEALLAFYSDHEALIPA